MCADFVCKKKRRLYKLKTGMVEIHVGKFENQPQRQKQHGHTAIFLALQAGRTNVVSKILSILRFNSIAIDFSHRPI
jgi:hypothetical protein